MPDDPIPFTDGQRQLFQRIAALIRSRPNDFTEAGRWLDAGAGCPDPQERFKQTREHWQAEAKSRRQIARTKGRETGRAYLVPPSGRALAVSRTVLARQMRSERADAARRPNFYQVVQYANESWRGTPPVFDDMTPTQAVQEARRVLLVAWLLTDTADLTTETPITGLQRWDWGEHVLEFVEPVVACLRGEEAVPRPIPRRYARRVLLYPEIGRWEGLCRDAVRVLDEAGDSKGDPAQAAPVPKAMAPRSTAEPTTGAYCPPRGPGMADHGSLHALKVISNLDMALHEMQIALECLLDGNVWLDEGGHRTHECFTPHSCRAALECAEQAEACVNRAAAAIRQVEPLIDPNGTRGLADDVQRDFADVIQRAKAGERFDFSHSLANTFYGVRLYRSQWAGEVSPAVGPTEDEATGALESAPPTSLGQWAGAKELLLAVVYTDIADSVVIQQKLGVEKSRELRDSHIARARRLVGDSNNTGHYVNNTGDGVLCVFRSAASALDFALALESDPGDPQITIRCAIDTGLVAITNDDTVHGRPVNYAARIRDACRQSTIWISHAAKIEIDQQGAARHARLDWHRHRPQKFKGFKDSPVVWSLDNPANSSSATSTATDLESGQRRRDSSRTIQMP